ncbi:4-amino-4-deoxychorismate lyase [Paramicrobacterium humi]|uniref:4-amino-4-deoxychorismate lyase n=1 Tax=Paramicrobacterium humi TaxID=640635 RepID=A0A1H4J0H0_9MICO|nr:aminotransferase class IV [Microbacterium humi]SEB39810.1 4-amino-4-deoxychorismate lyase [Microbacterium humi]
MARAFLITPLPADSADTDFEARLRPILPEERVLSIHDAGATRGDGVFETVGMTAGIVRKAEAHVERLAASAAKMDLPAPHPGQWLNAIERVARELPDTGAAVIRLVITRGLPDAGPTCWIVGQPSPAHVSERVDGVRVVLLDRGWPININSRAPWMLAGAKTLSYAPNMAALREARRRGADDVIFTSLEGFAMEGPTSSLIVRIGDTFVTPAADDGILPGTTQQELFAWLRAQGRQTASRRVLADEVRSADAAWLVSSVRLVVPVTAIDGASTHVDADLTARMNEALLAG